MSGHSLASCCDRVSCSSYDARLALQQRPALDSFSRQRTGLIPLCAVQASVREVKRLDSISRSPVYSSIGEALAGLPTIRAYRCEGRLSARNADLVDGSVIMSLVNMSMNRWPAAETCHASLKPCACSRVSLATPCTRVLHALCFA